MQVSVIIAVYNRASLLPDLLDHWRKVDEVTKYEYELIFSDDESSDQSLSILRECKDLPIRVLTNEHGGAGKARNHAYQYATGEIIIFTGDDIFPTANFINEHFESYLKNGQDFATLGCIDWREGIQMNHLMKHITDIGCEQFGFVGMRPFEVIDFRHFYTSNISVSRKHLQQIEHLFDPAFKKYGFEDIDLGYRLHKMGVQIIYNPNALGFHDHIYDSVEKFCRRQQSAGEELNTFKRLHPELGINEIKFDIDEFHKKYLAYASGNKVIDIVGDFGRLLIHLMKQFTKVFETILEKKNSSKIKEICSKFYSSIFSYYMYLGLAVGYIEAKPSQKYAAQRFTFRYLFFGKSQIFYDKSNHFTENNSVLFHTAGEKTITLKSSIPPEYLGRLRFDPLNFNCKIKLIHAFACLSDGSKEDIRFEFTNANHVKGNSYDFSNQVDPVLISDFLPENTLSVDIQFKINYLLHKKIYQSSAKLLRFAKKVFKKGTRFFKDNLLKKKKTTMIHPRISQVSENERKIWITVTGPSNQDVISLVKYYQQESSFLADLHIDVVTCPYQNYTEYVYEITTIKNAMEASQLVNTALCLLQHNYDFIFVSDSLKYFPILTGHSIKDSLLLTKHLAPFEKFINGSQACTGRLLRIPGSKRIENEVDITTQIPTIKTEDGKTLYINHPNDLVWNNKLNLIQVKKNKPLVIVLPVFMAVGGVERNTIEIMERLKKDYDFVVITFESHRTEQGSLFYQVAELGIDYYDFAEIASFDKYIYLLEHLKFLYNPDLVWICNSSPWTMENSSEIRRIYNDIPIVVQDVYDYEYGWIQYYNRPAVHSYDRFIAINQKIQEKFINTYSLNSADIDLVYSAVDTAKILKTSSDNYSRDVELKSYNLDPQKMHFAFIGRFTEQKQPLKVLQLAKYIIESYSNVDFIMVGDGELAPEVDQLIANDAKMRGRIHRIKYIAGVSKFIKAIDGLIMTSIYEGLPIVTIEAMCVGTPIYSTDVGDISLFVKEKNTGVISESHEITGLKQAFDTFYSNLELYKQNSLLHTNENIEFFSSQRAADLMNQSFKKAIEKYKFR